jgi:uncharacterized membrane protein
MQGIFSDPDGSFSWRKTGTALCFILFAYCVISFTITHKFAEIPSGYEVILGMVFTFYFAKNSLSQVRFGKDPSLDIDNSDNSKK